jgi:hypothetical protein
VNPEKPLTSGRLIQEWMLQRVAVSLGPDLLSRTAFVGGCATALLVTDPASRDEVRFTDDVDVIVHVLGPGEWHRLQVDLRKRGFHPSLDDEVICRTRLGRGTEEEVIVDFMPDDAAILGFSNPWYADALRLAFDHRLPGDTVIRVVTAPYFVATKLQAYIGRGNNDPMGSRDIEDILNVVDGRPGLLEEIRDEPLALRVFVGAQIKRLLDEPTFDYAVQACALGNIEREALIFNRLESIARSD